MTDREMLELAAKAAGFEYNGVWFDERTGLLVWEPPTNYESRDWNPLTDDGDALRLAVKLRIEVDYYLADVQAKSDECNPVFELLSEHKDDCAATRRAITRAAASIGKSMESKE